MIIDDYIYEKVRTSVSTQIAQYNYIKGSSKRPESFKNCIARFRILVLTDIKGLFFRTIKQ